MARTGKRGYFFVVDAMIGITILFLGLFLVFSSGARSFDQAQPLTTLEDFATVTGAYALSESTNSYYTSTLLPARVVPFPDATPLEEVGYLLLLYNQTGNSTYRDYAGNFTKSLLDDSVEQRYGASVSINGTIVYSRPIPPTSFSISRSTVLYVRMNETSVYGPMLSEVRLWH